MFLVIIGGIAGLYFRLGRLTQGFADNTDRLVRLERAVFNHSDHAALSAHQAIIHK